MKQITEKLLLGPNFILSVNLNLLHTLIITLFCVFLIWYAQYHWNRKKLYQTSAQLNGPLALPFLGSAWFFVTPTTNLFYNILNNYRKFNSPISLWIGQRLVFMVWGHKDMETIMNSRHALEKDDMYKFTEVVLGTGLLTASVSKWKRHRKIIMPTFNQKILDEYVEPFSQKSEILVELLRKEVNKGVFDVFRYISRCTMDIVCETVMGITVNEQTTNSKVVDAMERAMEITFQRMLNIFYHPDFIFNKTSLSSELNNNTTFLAFIVSIIKEKRKAYQTKLMEIGEESEEPQKRNDFLQHLIDLSESFTDEELREEVATFMIGISLEDVWRVAEFTPFPDRVYYFLLNYLCGRLNKTFIWFKGPKYAMMDMKTLIGTVIRKCRVFADYKNIEDIKLKQDFLLRAADGCMISIELR